ncbi:alpha/beta hydrolase [Candidatus Gracilibacteria bacterium]|nr:alpha/beta hydrolase [Candidatus Gracilibacteria bacterium]
MKQIIKWVLTLLVIFVLWIGALYFFQERFLFFPSSEIADQPVKSSLSWDEVSWQTTDGNTLHGRWMETKGADGTVLYFHGNAGNISHLNGQLYIFQVLNKNALIFDYRGFGESDGIIQKEQDLYEDSLSALTFLTEEKNISPSDIILWGQSLGSAFAVELAQKEPFAAVVLDFPFLSLPLVSQIHYPFLPVQWLLKYKFNNREKIKNIQSPLLIFYSNNDEVVPATQSETLFQQAKEPKKIVELAGSHNRAISESIEIYLREARDFLQNTSFHE